MVSNRYGYEYVNIWYQPKNLKQFIRHGHSTGVGRILNCYSGWGRRDWIISPVVSVVNVQSAVYYLPFPLAQDCSRTNYVDHRNVPVSYFSSDFRNGAIKVPTVGYFYSYVWGRYSLI